MTTRIIVVWVFLAICCQSGFGTPINEPADCQLMQAESVKEFLTPDGRFNLEAARRAGYEGALDLSNFAISLDPATEEPLFSRMDQEGTINNDHEHWRGGSVPCQQGKNMDTTVWALTIYNNNLVAGGTFVWAGCTHVSRIASWDGISWDSVGCGLQSGWPLEVYAMTVYGGDLIVGGAFTGVGCWPGIPANCIARWNGSSWSGLGTGMTGGGPITAVYALTVYAGKLIAGGNFTQAGGNTARYIAQWNGSSWSSLGTGMGHAPPTMYPTVYALTVYNNDLFAGGVFDSSGGTPANDIARWNGSSWSALGSGIQGGAYALTVYGTDLIVGGLFTQAGGVPANHIASWNGSSWSALGTGMSGGWITQVSALTVYGGDLIAAGIFTQAGGISANHIARWNGSSWSAMGSGLNGGTYPRVCALTVYNNKLIAGGNFTQAGGIPANFIASWDGSSWSRVGYVCGDANGDGQVDLADAVFLINYLFIGGPPPVPLDAGDANSDGTVDLADAVYIINYLFIGGPPPGGGKAVASSKSEIELYKGKTPAQVGFSSPIISKDGIFGVPVMGKFDVDLAGVQLEIKYDPEEIVLLEPALTQRTESLTIYSSSNKSIQSQGAEFAKIGIIDLSGEHYISAGTGALVNLRVKGSDLSSRFASPASGEASLTTSLEITKAILVDQDAQKIPVNIVTEMKKSEEGLAVRKSAVPQEFSLSQNYPNPFNPETEIKYALPQDCDVTLIIYNILGEKTKVLVNEYQTAGFKTVYWDGKDEKGKGVASGTYFYRIKAGDFSQSRKMVLVK